MSYKTTESPIFEEMLDNVDVGQIAAAVPCVFNGELGVWSTAGYMPPPRDDLDVLAQVFVSIRHARLQLERAGGHPVH